MKRLNYKNNKGFSLLAIILVIISVIVVIGVWSMSASPNISNNLNNGLDIQANNIINDSNAIKLSYDNLKNSGVDISTIVFIPNTDSTVAAPNILDPATGITVPTVDPKSVRVGASTTVEGRWVYAKAFGAENVNGTRVNAIVIAGLKNDVCKRINYAITGSEFVPTRYSDIRDGVYVIGATAAKPMTSSGISIFNPVVIATNWKRGCVSTSNIVPDNNVYFLHL